MADQIVVRSSRARTPATLEVRTTGMQGGKGVKGDRGEKGETGATGSTMSENMIVDGGTATTSVEDHVLRLDFGHGGASINPKGKA